MEGLIFGILRYVNILVFPKSPLPSEISHATQRLVESLKEGCKCFYRAVTMSGGRGLSP